MKNDTSLPTAFPILDSVVNITPCRTWKVGTATPSFKSIFKLSFTVMNVRLKAETMAIDEKRT